MTWQIEIHYGQNDRGVRAYIEGILMENIKVLRNGFLIDGNGGDPIPDSTVVVVDGTIREVIKGEKSLTVPCGHEIDLKGRTLMPGLIDAHVHPGNVEVVMERTVAHPPAVYVHKASRILEEDLWLGFTTVRDAGGLDWGFREAVEQGLIRGPRLLLSVAPLTQTGGHGDKRDKARNEHVPRNSLGIFPAVCDGPDEVRKAARDMIRRGADHIKVMADGGVMSPTGDAGNWQFTVEEIRAAVETAEAAGTYVMAHVYSPRAIGNCLEAGVRSIEHGNLMDTDTALLMREKGAYLVPTLTVFDVMPREGRAAGVDETTLNKMRKVSERSYQALELAYKAGVKIGSGTDLLGPLQNLKGRELALKAKVMTPMEAIVSATRTNAELLGMEDRLGVAEPGKLADLIVIDGNPLDDLSLFEHGRERVVLVMKEGKIVKNIM
ncbi:MAG: amidohydrolase family protein [Deltaproteobacteria bacterium]|nr:amidohydrolase family protein [Deltaproteobacteria bacterium]